MIYDQHLLSLIFSFVSNDIYAVLETCKDWNAACEVGLTPLNNRCVKLASSTVLLKTTNIPTNRVYIQWAKSHSDFRYRSSHCDLAPLNEAIDLIKDGCPCTEKTIIKAIKACNLQCFRALLSTRFLRILVTEYTVCEAIRSGNIAICNYVSKIGLYFARDTDACYKAAVKAGNVDVLEWTINFVGSVFRAENWGVEAVQSKNADMIDFIIQEASENIRHCRDSWQDFVLVMTVHANPELSIMRMIESSLEAIED